MGIIRALFEPPQGVEVIFALWAYVFISIGVLWVLSEHFLNLHMVLLFIFALWVYVFMSLFTWWVLPRTYLKLLMPLMSPFSRRGLYMFMSIFALWVLSEHF